MQIKLPCIKNYFLPIVAAMAIFFSSCGGSDKNTQGVIEFEITYPYYQGSGFMASMLPDKMIMTYKDGVYKSEVSKGKIFSSCFIIDCNKKTMTNLFHFGTKNYYAVLNEKQTKKLLLKEPVPQYLETNDGDSLAGFLCKKTVAYYEELEQPDVAIYSTTEIEIPDANWWTPFHKVDGVLLGYEVERFDFRMRFTAVKFTETEVDESEFKVPSQYKKVSIEKIEKELKEVFGTLSK
jgi:hypothetical protein